jgi:hypothetical protein
MFHSMWLLTETKQLTYQLFLSFSYIYVDISVCDHEVTFSITDRAMGYDTVFRQPYGRIVPWRIFFFWDISPCIPLKANRFFGGTCRHRLQDRRISRARNQRDSIWVHFQRTRRRCVQKTELFITTDVANSDPQYSSVWISHRGVNSRSAENRIQTTWRFTWHTSFLPMTNPRSLISYMHCLAQQCNIPIMFTTA